jgi:hypothetical protein
LARPRREIQKQKHPFGELVGSSPFRAFVPFFCEMQGILPSREPENRLRIRRG